MTNNSLSVHIESGDIFYQNVNTGENFYNFILAQQDDQTAPAPKQISYHNSFEFSILILSLPCLGLRSKSTSLGPGFCLYRPRQYNTICWELNLISGFFVFFWLFVWADGINKCGWYLAGGWGLLTQRPASDPKCKLNISSFLIPHTSTFIKLSHLY